jgi:hypothetical protein
LKEESVSWHFHLLWGACRFDLWPLLPSSFNPSDIGGVLPQLLSLWFSEQSYLSLATVRKGFPPCRTPVIMLGLFTQSTILLRLKVLNWMIWKIPFAM